MHGYCRWRGLNKGKLINQEQKIVMSCANVSIPSEAEGNLRFPLDLTYRGCPYYVPLVHRAPKKPIKLWI